MQHDISDIMRGAVFLAGGKTIDDFIIRVGSKIILREPVPITSGSSVLVNTGRIASLNYRSKAAIVNMRGGRAISVPYSDIAGVA